jgi:hypothetical protein
MSARVFIGHRQDEGAGLANALGDELDALFGDGQVARLAPGAPSEAQWREALSGTSGAMPILVLLVSPDTGAAGAGPGADDPAHALLDAALAAGAQVRPVLAGSLAALADAEELPSPFDRASRLPRRPLRAAEWAGDVARIGEDLRELGVRPLAGTQPGTMPVPLPRDGPTTTPMPLEESQPEPEPTADGGRRAALGVGAALLLLGGWGVWRWQQRRPPNLAGSWRAQIGRPGAPTSRDGPLMIVKLKQTDRRVSLISTLDVASDPAWEAVRSEWKERTGAEFVRVDYRGEGEIRVESVVEPGPPSAAEAASDSASGQASRPQKRARSDSVTEVQRVVVAIRITPQGYAEQVIYQGTLRAVLNDRHIQGRLALEGEPEERVVDLQREN